MTRDESQAQIPQADIVGPVATAFTQCALRSQLQPEPFENCGMKGAVGQPTTAPVQAQV
jgi:hypothetical protein